MIVDTITDSSHSSDTITPNSDATMPVSACNTLSIPSHKRRRRRDRQRSLMQEMKDVSPSRMEPNADDNGTDDISATDNDRLSNLSMHDTKPVLNSFDTVDNLSDTVSNNNALIRHDSVDRATVIIPPTIQNDSDNNMDERTTRKYNRFHENSTLSTSDIHNVPTDNIPRVHPRTDMDNISLASSVSTLSSISTSSAGTQDGSTVKSRLPLDSCSDLEHLG